MTYLTKEKKRSDRKTESLLEWQIEKERERKRLTDRHTYIDREIEKKFTQKKNQDTFK